ncbi:hydroxyacylglutathione hydrolase [Durotheca rogersii]|uniref:hydroxyacylglutathione hydrolase n=1 Tax=Durotheca rogersii TaxID=419775 RepID=UPI002221054C|nr:hydroxyacylglutathione hydrolase [Durotheca rogersii]KAI5862789.1 hydroxyacylglutathione hydrolase [Durotheca rogersii]
MNCLARVRPLLTAATTTTKTTTTATATLRNTVRKAAPLSPALAFARAMHIQAIPMWTGSHDNYAYLLVDEKTREAAIIDPANPDEVVPVLKEAIESKSIKLTTIVNTHHHWDHAGGNDQIKTELGNPGLLIIGGNKCQSVDLTPPHGKGFKLGDNLEVKALHTPCHTQDSICWYVDDGVKKAVFTGDTLFNAGCGRFFEGNAQEMCRAFETLAALPDDTKVYPGHEYTKSNVKFGATILLNAATKRLQADVEKYQQTQGKYTIADEKEHNVFMRVHDPEVQKATGKTDPVDVMDELRTRKNNFK